MLWKLTIYLLSESENKELSDPAKNNKGMGRSTYVIAAKTPDINYNYIRDFYHHITISEMKRSNWIVHYTGIKFNYPFNSPVSIGHQLLNKEHACHIEHICNYLLSHIYAYLQQKIIVTTNQQGGGKSTDQNLQDDSSRDQNGQKD